MTSPSDKAELEAQAPPLPNSEKNDCAESSEIEESRRQANVWLDAGFSEDDASFMQGFPEKKKKKVLKKVSQ